MLRKELTIKELKNVEEILSFPNAIFIYAIVKFPICAARNLKGENEIKKIREKKDKNELLKIFRYLWKRHNYIFSYHNCSYEMFDMGESNEYVGSLITKVGWLIQQK
jgi:hypothetical protein